LIVSAVGRLLKNVFSWLVVLPSAFTWSVFISRDRNLVSDKPHNPMVNAGAIVICSLILELVQPQTPLAEKYDMVSAYVKVNYTEFVMALSTSRVLPFVSKLSELISERGT